LSFSAVSSSAQNVEHMLCHVTHKDMLQHYFTHYSRTCLSSTPANKSLKIISVIYVTHLLLTLPWHHLQ